MQDLYVTLHDEIYEPTVDSYDRTLCEAQFDRSISLHWWNSSACSSDMVSLSAKEESCHSPKQSPSARQHKSSTDDQESSPEVLILEPTILMIHLYLKVFGVTRLSRIQIYLGRTIKEKEPWNINLCEVQDQFRWLSLHAGGKKKTRSRIMAWIQPLLHVLERDIDYIVLRIYEDRGMSVEIKLTETLEKQWKI